MQMSIGTSLSLLSTPWDSVDELKILYTHNSEEAVLPYKQTT